MIARGITATSGRHSRSCDGEMKLNHTTTARNSAAKAHLARAARLQRSAQTLKARKVSASTARAHAQGRAL